MLIMFLSFYSWLLVFWFSVGTFLLLCVVYSCSMLWCQNYRATDKMISVVWQTLATWAVYFPAILKPVLLLAKLFSLIECLDRLLTYVCTQSVIFALFVNIWTCICVHSEMEHILKRLWTIKIPITEMTNHVYIYNCKVVFFPKGL